MMVFGKPIEQMLGIAAILLLAIGCAVVLWPFLSALLWACVICFCTWPIYSRCERMLGGRRGLAALLMTVLIGLIVVAPFAVMAVTLGDNVRALIVAATRVLEQGPPAPPHWVAGLPVIGESLAAYWESLAHNAPAFMAELKKVIGPAADIVMASGAVVGVRLLELAISLFVAFFIYRDGRKTASYVHETAERIAGPRAKHLLSVVGGTVQGVVYGLIGTALAQAMLVTIGFWIVAVPQALLLGFVTFVLAFLPAGPVFVWVAVALWLLFEESFWRSLFIAAWGVLLVSSIDNLLRPYVLAKANSLPVVVAFLGILGGILAFGFIGVFLGPTLLAVGYSLFLEWHAVEMEEHKRP